MCAILNGIGYHGIFRASGATFLVFADYCRASICLAALSNLPIIYIFTHDSWVSAKTVRRTSRSRPFASVRVIPQLRRDSPGRS